MPLFTLPTLYTLTDLIHFLLHPGLFRLKRLNVSTLTPGYWLDSINGSRRGNERRLTTKAPFSHNPIPMTVVTYTLATQLVAFSLGLPRV